LKVKVQTRKIMSDQEMLDMIADIEEVADELRKEILKSQTPNGHTYKVKPVRIEKNPTTSVQTSASPVEDVSVDMVNHPLHYTNTSVECIQAMIETQGIEAVKHFCECNAFKYMWRHNSKNGNEDVKKAKWYVNKAVELIEEEEGER